MNQDLSYKDVLRVIRSNFNVRLQQKTNYGRNEMYNIVDAVLADSLADLLENNIPKTSDVLKKEVADITKKTEESNSDLPWS